MAYCNLGLICMEVLSLELQELTCKLDLSSITSMLFKMLRAFIYCILRHAIRYHIL